MQRLKHLLVALNGSAAGNHALIESVRLAHWSKGGVTAMTVVPPYAGDLNLVGVKHISSLMTGDAGEILKQAFDAAEALGMRIDVCSAAGDPAVEIAGYYEAGNYDGVVLGVNHRPAPVRFLRGNVRSRIIRFLPSAEVLLIPETATVSWEKLLLITDAAATDSGTWWRANEVARVYGGRLEGCRLARRHLGKGGRAGSPTDKRLGIPEGNARAILQRILQENIEMVLLSRGIGARREMPWPGLIDRIVALNRPLLILKPSYVPVSASQPNLDANRQSQASHTVFSSLDAN
jgi:nucleotide-binding universal stress UspA family protein